MEEVAHSFALSIVKSSQVGFYWHPSEYARVESHFFKKHYATRNSTQDYIKGNT